MRKVAADVNKIPKLKNYTDKTLKDLYKRLYVAIEVEEKFGFGDLSVCQAVKYELENRGYILPDGYPFIIEKERVLGRCRELERFKSEEAKTG